MNGAATPTVGRAIVRITLWGAAANLLLSAVKLVLGSLLGSIALLAAGIHSLSDLATDVVVILGARLASRPPDRSHPYGHGRFETMATMLVSAALFLAGASVAWKAGRSLYLHERAPVSWLILAVAGASVVVKEILFRQTRVVAKRVFSSSLMANAWHHRSDALSSVAVMAGAGVGLLGWDHGDQVAGLLVGLMIVAVAGKLAAGALSELTEGGIAAARERDVQKALAKVGGVRGWHRLRARLVGRQVFLDVHVLVDPRLDLLKAHAISLEVEKAVADALAKPANITVHVEPDIPEERSS